MKPHIQDRTVTIKVKVKEILNAKYSNANHVFPPEQCRHARGALCAVPVACADYGRICAPAQRSALLAGSHAVAPAAFHCLSQEGVELVNRQMRRAKK